MLLCRVKYARAGRRRVSCPISRSLAHSLNNSPVQRPELLTLLHKTTSLLPRALPTKEHAKDLTESLNFWNQILLDEYKDLVSQEPRQARIAVFGLNQWSDAIDLVTSLLEEPLLSDQSLNAKIRSRWTANSGQSRLSLSSLPCKKDAHIHISSSFFQQFSIPPQFIEISSQNSVPSASDLEISNLLSRADVSIVVFNPITNPISSVINKRYLFQNPNTILAVTAAPSKSILQDMETYLSKSFPEAMRKKLKILFVDPSRALEANMALVSSSQTAIAVQRYQDDYNGSRVSLITEALKDIISPSGFTISTLRHQTALAHIQAALSACQAVLNKAKTEIDSVAVDVCTLKARLEEAKVRAQFEVLDRSPDAERDAVVVGMKHAAEDIRRVMDRLTWWRMIWRVDEISHLVAQAVLRPGGGELEQQLVFQTGRLTVLQDEITNSMFALLAAHSYFPFNSSILKNSLHQIMASPSFHVTPQSLTHPIDTRRSQVIQHSTMRLHLIAQRATLGMGGGVAAGATIGWAGWLGWLAGHGEGLLGAVGLDSATAIGIGLLIAISSIRLGVGQWERAKRRWWEDWERIVDGLGRDLRVTLNQTMEKKVLVVAETGCEGLSNILTQRRREVEEIEEELDALKTTLDSLDGAEK
ncbi:hypothetical protein H0H93_005823 [Arthromyces matolae]|nr:hypothetical protein H0H93_005823 [Arthromyces matolae]